MEALTATRQCRLAGKIAAIAQAHDVTILEDDIYGLLPAERPVPLARHAPERTVYVTSFSKTLAPGLRIGFLTAPARLIDRMIPALGATTWMAAPLLAELAASLIEDGTAGAILRSKRKEAEARQDLARQRGVAVNPGEVFVAGAGKPPAAVRVCLGAARTRDRLEKGLWILRDILGGAASHQL